MFDVTLVKMEDTEKKARTRQLEGKGILEQYPAYEEEDGWDEEDDWEDAPEDFAEEAEDAPFEDNILRDFFLGEDWDEEDDLDIMSPVEVLPIRASSSSLLFCFSSFSMVLFVGSTSTGDMISAMTGCLM